VHAVVTFAALTVFVVTGCASGDDDTEDGTTFRSRMNGYTMTIPAGWSAIAATGALAPAEPPLTGPPITDVISAHPDRRVSRMKLPALVVGARVPHLPCGPRPVTLVGRDRARRSRVPPRVVRLDR
jgi:hypothetical protein